MTPVGPSPQARTPVNKASAVLPPDSCRSHQSTVDPALDDPAMTARYRPPTVTTVLMPARPTATGSGSPATTDITASAVPMEFATSPGARTPHAYAPTAWSCPATTTGVPARSPQWTETAAAPPT